MFSKKKNQNYTYYRSIQKVEKVLDNNAEKSRKNTKKPLKIIFIINLKSQKSDR